MSSVHPTNYLRLCDRQAYKECLNAPCYNYEPHAYTLGMAMSYISKSVVNDEAHTMAPSSLYTYAHNDVVIQEVMARSTTFNSLCLYVNAPSILLQHLWGDQLPVDKPNILILQQQMWLWLGQPPLTP